VDVGQALVAPADEGPPVTGATDVRRPWLPAGLRAHGLTQDDVATLTYVLIDEIVGSSVTLALSSWPWADARGRLRFAIDDTTRGVAVDLAALERALYRGWLRRSPRVGDVFGARVPERVHELQEPSEAPLWTRPVAELFDGPVYDLTQEARTVAKLATDAVVAGLLPTGLAERLDLPARRAAQTKPVPRRDAVRAEARDA
jgi:hypothetical protein